MQQQDCSEIIVTRRLKCKKLPIISLPVDEANNKLQQSCWHKNEYIQIQYGKYK